MPWIKTILILTSALGFSCCSTRKSFDKDIPSETKPASRLPAGSSASVTNNAVKEIFEATYLLRVKTERGRELCEGAATLIGYTNFYTKLKGDAKCSLGTKLDLSKLLGTNDEYVPATKEEASKLPHYGKVSRVKKFRGYEFSPPRPFILGPVVQRSSDYAGFEFTEQLTVTEKPDTSQAKTYSGSMAFKVLHAGIRFQPEGYTQEFPDVLHWQYEAYGFDGINRGETMLYDHFEFYWSTKPIAIPMMVISGPVDNFVASGIVGAIGNVIMKRLTIELILRQHTQL